MLWSASIIVRSRSQQTVTELSWRGRRRRVEDYATWTTRGNNFGAVPHIGALPSSNFKRFTIIHLLFCC